MATEEPWLNLEKCHLATKGGGLLVLAILIRNEKPCDRCNESRAKCGGLPSQGWRPSPMTDLHAALILIAIIWLGIYALADSRRP